MALNYYHLTPPSKYQRHADYNSLPRYTTYIIIDFYIITVLDCKVSPLLIFYECFFVFPPFCFIYCIVLSSYESMRTRFHPTTNDCSSYGYGVATPSSYDYYCRTQKRFLVFLKLDVVGAVTPQHWKNTALLLLLLLLLLSLLLYTLARGRSATVYKGG